MSDRRMVHVLDAQERLLYTRLWDDGTNILFFADGSGFVLRDQVERSFWVIADGWPDTRAVRGEVGS